MKRFFAALLALALLCAPALAFGPAGETVHGIDVSVYQGNVDFSRVAQSGRAHGLYTLHAGLFLRRSHARAQCRWRARGGAGVWLLPLLHRLHHRRGRARRRASSPRPSPATIMGSSRCMELSPARGLEPHGDNRCGVGLFAGSGAAHGPRAGHLLFRLHRRARITTAAWPLTASGWRSTARASRRSNDIWPTWAGWQYSERGRVDGIEGNVDLDLFTAEMRAEPEPTKSASPTSRAHAQPRADRDVRADRHRRHGRGQRLCGAGGRHAHAPSRRCSAPPSKP